MPKECKMSWFKKLKDGLGKSTSKVSASLSSLSGLFGGARIDASSLEEVEDALISADLGTASAQRLAARMRRHKFEGPIDSDTLGQALADGITEILEPVAQKLEIDDARSPHVVLLVGVNGSGKTTTAGKLAQQWRDEGKSVMLAAGDTFRAAAIEQLQIWGARTGTEVIAGAQGGDAAALAYEALEKAKAANIDVLIIDTAGRLQNRSELMDELAKIVRVMRKLDESAPHDSVIILDGTVGQNAISQVKAFREVADVTGLIVTKLDGSAKGGVVVALAEEFGLPVHAVGVGEQADDLQPFAAAEFAKALVGIDTE
ncbi:MAG: signal recognition particle-docking protein FtsY [Candidatus Puniceispirillum sp.]|nr:signal recognition particle-docking protein FtsY [Candidatus Puniceispirillum sp.]MBT6565972.1 signal recognition particle-docking protein FtsY [Candidatus Puniceispirillum sp.]